jgi:hypothetical protein
MFWRLFNFLFGWHYVFYKDTATTRIFRVIILPNGEYFMRDTIGIYSDFLDSDGKFRGSNGTWNALTFDGKEVSKTLSGVEQ